jgi:oligopeptide transport system substrate-binding protein
LTRIIGGMKRVLIWPTVFLILLGVIGFTVSRGGAQREADAVTICNADEISTLDPGRMSWQNDIRTAMGLWEGLVSYDPKTLEPIPGAATWELSKDGLTYTFKLRENGKWSNGDRVVAGDFIFAWKRVLTPSTAADYSNLLFYIKGAEKYFDAVKAMKPGDAPPKFEDVAIRSPDDHTLIVTLQNPCTYFLDLVAFPVFYPLHEKSMSKFADANPRIAYDLQWTRPPNLVTNGPFYLAEWEFKRYLKLMPNPHYWDRAAVKAPAIYIQAISDQGAAMRAYAAGEVDVLTFVPPDFGHLLLQERDAGRRGDVNYRPVFGTYYFMFNCAKPPFDNKLVRRALALSIDKTKLVKDVTKMRQKPTNVIVPPDSIPGYAGPRGLDRDVELARKLMAEAGYPGGKNFPEVEILYNNEAAHQSVSQALGQMWQEALGITVTFRGVERGGFRNDRRNHNFQISRAGWYGDFMDPTTWLDLCKTGDGNNDGLFSNKKFDEILKDAAKTVDPKERFTKLAEAEKILVEDEMPFIPLYVYSDGYIFDSKKIGGLEMNVRTLTQFKYVHKR